MFAFLTLSTGASFGYLCAVSGFFIIVASVLFVIKGKMAIGEGNASNTIEWGKIKANLTSAVFLFVLGAAMIAFPFWRESDTEAKERVARSAQPATAILTGKITGPGGKNLRLLLVEKPDYDQTYGGEIVWEFPLVTRKASYSVFYVDGDVILHQQSFSVEGAASSAQQQKIKLPTFDLQTRNSIAETINPQLEVSDAELNRLGVH